MANFLGITILTLALALNFSNDVAGHGRLLDPPSRSSIWRFQEFAHLSPETNYNDNELFCGGLAVQILNGGKCGECGDAWNAPRPRDNEAGGLYGRGIITKNYKAGQKITIQVDLTANHKGDFEFRLCPHNQPNVPVNQDCLDRHVLELADGSGTRYPIYGDVSGLHEISVKLPQGVTCDQCVLQWHYRTANSFGECLDGSFGIGCGQQETFRSCADVSIN